MTPTDMLIPTYTAIARHSKACPYKDKGRAYSIETAKCTCRKHIAVYDPRVQDPKKRHTHFIDSDGVIRRSPIATKTRVWTEAEQIAQAYRDKHDPDKKRAAAAEAKLKTLQAEKESKTVTIEQAVARFLASKRAERISEKRIERYLPLLGDVDPKTFKFKSNRRGNEGRLSEWLKTLNPRPIYVSDLRPDLVEAFRNTWNFESDLTDFGTFGDLNGSSITAQTNDGLRTTR